MAIEQIVEKSVKLIKRTWQIIADAPYDGDYRISFQREILEADPISGAVTKQGKDGEVVRFASNVPTDLVTLTSGKTISALELAEALKRFGDKWYNEDRPV